MTLAGIIQCEKERSAQVWHDLYAAPIKAGAYEPIIQRHLLKARADQIRDSVSLLDHDRVKGKEFGAWGVAPATCYGCQQEALATTLEAACEGGQVSTGRSGDLPARPSKYEPIPSQRVQIESLQRALTEARETIESQKKIIEAHAPDGVQWALDRKQSRIDALSRALTRAKAEIARLNALEAAAKEVK